MSSPRFSELVERTIFTPTVLATLTLFPVSASAQTAGRVEVYAHRGARAFSPENTLPAFKTALRIGADRVDMDVVLTKDNEVLVCHDLVLNPDITRDERGKFLAQSSEALAKRPPVERLEYDRKFAVLDLTLEELARFEVGRLNPDSAYSRFFLDQFPVDGTRMPTLYSGCDGSVFISIWYPIFFPAAFSARRTTSRRVGMRVPSTGTWSRKNLE